MIKLGLLPRRFILSIASLLPIILVLFFHFAIFSVLLCQLYHFYKLVNYKKDIKKDTIVKTQSII